jgi:hypothetical protein
MQELWGKKWSKFMERIWKWRKWREMEGGCGGNIEEAVGGS